MTDSKITDPISEIVTHLNSAISKCRAAADLAEALASKGEIDPECASAFAVLLESSRAMKITAEHTEGIVELVKDHQRRQASGSE